MGIHVLQTAKQSDGEKMSLAEMRETMPYCPICGRKAYLMHIIVDGFDFGYDVGCPVFCLDDGIHGISESYDPNAPHINSYSAEKAVKAWKEYCDRMEEKKHGILEESGQGYTPILH